MYILVRNHLDKFHAINTFEGCRCASDLSLQLRRVIPCRYLDRHRILNALDPVLSNFVEGDGTGNREDGKKDHEGNQPRQEPACVIAIE